MDVDLDEGAGELLRLPRGSRLARAQPNDHVLPADRLARMERDILDDAIPLVEDSEHRDSLRHRSDAGLAGPDWRRRIGDYWSRRILLGRLLAAGGDSQHRQDCERSSGHVYSGIHGW